MFVETISIVYLIAAKEATNCTNKNLSRKYCLKPLTSLHLSSLHFILQFHVQQIKL